jgi:inner membrane transporter RhtA
MATTSPTGHRDPLARVPSPALVVGGICSVQFGSALAATIFHRAGPAGVVLLRLVAASLALAAVWRPGARSRTSAQLRLAILFGVVLAVMNLSFYEAIDRIPLGVGVAIEFLGPLAVALLGSRARRDVLWVALAGLGVFALTHGSVHGLDPLGVGFALLAGAAWGTYILVNAQLGQAYADGAGTTLGMCTAALIALPFGIAEGGGHLLEPHVLAFGAAVGVLSSAIPYTLELEALRRIAASVFGVLMSLEPAVAALAGFLVLGQGLSARELAGIALVMVASAGASRGGRRRVPVD